MTYSIVAYDPEKGELGVAVQTALPFVGTRCPFAEAGVGVVASQAQGRMSHGQNGLALMRGTHTAPQALAGVLVADSDREVRQVAMLDAQGNVATHTGSQTIQHAGHRVGEHYAAQANMMVKNTVWQVMGEAFEGTQGTLADRILAALEAAQAEGGDVRGAQSAALLIVPDKATFNPRQAFIHDARVDDSPQPLAALRHLVNLNQAYILADEAEKMIREDFEAGMNTYHAALALAPQEDQLRFWFPLMVADELGQLAPVENLLRDLFQRDPKWIATLKAYAAAYRLKREETLEQLLALGEQ